MRLSSIDDVVEHWMLDASSVVARLAHESRRIGPVLASHRRTFIVFACIAISSLFTPLFFFAVALVPFIIGGIAMWIQHMADGDRA